MSRRPEAPHSSLALRQQVAPRMSSRRTPRHCPVLQPDGRDRPWRIPQPNAFWAAPPAGHRSALERVDHTLGCSQAQRPRRVATQFPHG